MKHFLLFILIVFTNITFSQNYELVKPLKTNYFKDYKNFVHAFKVDSSYISGSDIIYNSFRRIRHFDTCFADIEAPIFGKNIIKKPNGIYKIVNAEYDTTLIKTQASLGETWQCFTDTLNHFIEAECTSIDYENILGNMDSVKTISFTLKNNGGAIISSPINNLHLKISQNYGLVAIVDFGLFPFIEITKNFQNSENPYTLLLLESILPNSTIKENFKESHFRSFEINDEFIYTKYEDWESYGWTSNHCGSSISHTITNKIDFPEYTTYSVKLKKNTSCYNGCQYIESNYEFNVSKKYLYNKTSFENDSSLNDLSYRIKISNKDTIYFQKFFFHTQIYEESCINYFETTGYISKEVGFPTIKKEGYSTPDETYYSTSTLKYYKKGNKEWGEYINVDIKNTEKESKQIVIFPNPNSGKFNISFNNYKQNYSLNILNLVGEKLYSKKANSKGNLIDLEFAKGTYFVQIISNEKVYIKKFVIN